MFHNVYPEAPIMYSPILGSPEGSEASIDAGVNSNFADSPLAPAEIQRVPPPPPTPLLGFSVEENDHKVSEIIIGATEQLDAENQWSHLPKCRFIHDDDAVSDSEESDTSLSPLGFGFSLFVDDEDASSDGLVSGSTPNIVDLSDINMDNDWLTQVNIRLFACAEVKEYCDFIEVSKDEGEASYEFMEIDTCVYPSPILGGENKFRDIKEDLKVVNQKIIDEVCSSRTHHLDNNIDSTRRHITLQRQYGHVDLIRLAIETTSNEDGSSDVESVGVDREIVLGTHPAFALGSSNGINGLGLFISAPVDDTASDEVVVASGDDIDVAAVRETDPFWIPGQQHPYVPYTPTEDPAIAEAGDSLNELIRRVEEKVEMVQSPFTLLLRGHKNGLHSSGALRRQQASTNLAGMAKAAFLEIDEADEFGLGITSAEVEVVAEDMGDSPISMPVTLSSPTGSARTPDTDGGPEYLCMLTAFSKRRSRRNNGRM